MSARYWGYVFGTSLSGRTFRALRRSRHEALWAGTISSLLLITLSEMRHGYASSTSSFRWRCHSDSPVGHLDDHVTSTHLVLRISLAGPRGRRRDASEPKPGSAAGRRYREEASHDLAVEESGFTGRIAEV